MHCPSSLLIIAVSRVGHERRDVALLCLEVLDLSMNLWIQARRHQVASPSIITHWSASFSLLSDPPRRHRDCRTQYKYQLASIVWLIHFKLHWKYKIQRSPSIEMGLTWTSISNSLLARPIARWDPPPVLRTAPSSGGLLSSQYFLLFLYSVFACFSPLYRERGSSLWFLFWSCYLQTHTLPSALSNIQDTPF